MARASESGGTLIAGSPPGEAGPVRKVRGKVAHATRGRVRLQFPGSSSAELQQIEARVRTLPHVSKVEVHPKTGSVIAHHGGGHDEFASHLADLAKHSALFYLELNEDAAQAAARLTDVEHDTTYLADHSKTGKAIVRYTEHLNRAVKHVTDGWVDLRVLLPAAAGVCALVFIEIESAPLWLPLALFSFQSFNNLHQPHPTTEGEAAGHPSLSAANPAPVGTPAETASETRASAAPQRKRVTRKAPVVRPEESA